MPAGATIRGISVDVDLAAVRGIVVAVGIAGGAGDAAPAVGATCCAVSGVADLVTAPAVPNGIEARFAAVVEGRSVAVGEAGATGDAALAVSAARGAIGGAADRVTAAAVIDVCTRVDARTIAHSQISCAGTRAAHARLVRAAKRVAVPAVSWIGCDVDTGPATVGVLAVAGEAALAGYTGGRGIGV